MRDAIRRGIFVPLALAALSLPASALAGPLHGQGIDRSPLVAVKGTVVRVEGSNLLILRDEAGTVRRVRFARRFLTVARDGGRIPVSALRAGQVVTVTTRPQGSRPGPEGAGEDARARLERASGARAPGHTLWAESARLLTDRAGSRLAQKGRLMVDPSYTASPETKDPGRGVPFLPVSPAKPYPQEE